MIIKPPIGTEGFFYYQGKLTRCIIWEYRDDDKLLVIRWSDRVGPSSNSDQQHSLVTAYPRIDYLRQGDFQWERPQESLFTKEN